MAKSILIVDDEPRIRVLLRQALEDLEDAGVTILEEGDGTAAVATATAKLPDVVLLDVMMPGMNGYEVTGVLRSDRRLKDTKIVLVTARGQEFDRVQGEMVGADRYVTKPFDPDAVLELVTELLGPTG